uniref:Uncharacterized protein n=1 Tax=Oryza glumipatula TaxID=40148 RepID=A0A0E0AH68_9ORYZ
MELHHLLLLQPPVRRRQSLLLLCNLIPSQWKLPLVGGWSNKLHSELSAPWKKLGATLIAIAAAVSSVTAAAVDSTRAAAASIALDAVPTITGRSSPCP